MSATTTAPETPPAQAGGAAGSRSLIGKIAAGTGIAAVLAATAIAVWPASEAEKAYDDGKAFGAAVAQLQAADTYEEVDDALVELSVAAQDTADHAGSAVTDQVEDQADALSRAADGFVGSHTADDSFEADLYQAELDYAVDDLTGNAEDFRTTGPEVQQSFWDGFDDGLNSN
jgi:hypothetical protein